MLVSLRFFLLLFAEVFPSCSRVLALGPEHGTLPLDDYQLITGTISRYHHPDPAAQGLRKPSTVVLTSPLIGKKRCVSCTRGWWTGRAPRLIVGLVMLQ